MMGLAILLQIIDGLVTEYDVSATGSAKWHKLATFLQKRYRIILHHETSFVQFAGENLCRNLMSKSA